MHEKQLFAISSICSMVAYVLQSVCMGVLRLLHCELLYCYTHMEKRCAKADDDDYYVVVCAGIEEIGVEIEDPFGILPLEVISNKAKADVLEIMNRQDVVKDMILTPESRSQEEINSTIFKVPMLKDTVFPQTVAR